jgi:hypothetical protein
MTEQPHRDEQQDVDVDADPSTIARVEEGDPSLPRAAADEPGATADTPDELGGTGGPDAGGAG